LVCATFRMKDVKIITAILTIILVILILIFSTYKYLTKDIIKLYTYSERIEYLENLDVSTDGITETIKTINIPSEFNDTYEQYAEVQISKGFPDLHTFKGEPATVYDYVLNDGSAVQLLICNDILVGTFINDNTE